MEQTTLERRVRIIPATKSAPASGPRRGGKQRVAAYCRVSTMYGFDKLKQTMEQFKNIKSK